MEISDTNIQAYTQVVMNKAFLDWEMQCLQTKIKCKNEENSKLENQICEHKTVLEKLKKSYNLSCEREEKVKNNINVLRNSRAITEGLLISMKHQLHVHEEKIIGIKNARKNILQKYTMLFDSQEKLYSSLPWVKKTSKLKILIEHRKIQLIILKSEYSSFKQKIALFRRIADQRIVVAITKMAKDIVARNNLQKEAYSLLNNQKILEAKLIQLNEEKLKLQERIHLKVKEAMKEARDRVVKAHVGASETLNSAQNLVISSISNQLNPTNESIFSRLGLSVPQTLKRPSAIRAKISEKVPCLVRKSNKTEDQPVQMVYAVEEKTGENNDGLDVANAADILAPIHVSEPVKQAFQRETEDINKKAHGERDKDKQKLKKKVKRNLNKASESVVVPENKIQKSFVSENNEVTSKEVPLKEKTDQPSHKLTATADIMSEPTREILEEVTHEKTMSPEKQISRPIVPIEEKGHEKMILNDPEMNNSNSSILDNISVVSSTFTNENRNLMDRSPDFLNQTPQGYCFSPLFSPSKSDNVTEKGTKSASYDFPNASSVVSPLFPMEIQKTPGASSSDFASFFGTTSPKKSDTSTKNFFQLFG